MLEKAEQLVQEALPDAQVEFIDFKNDGRHFLLNVTSSAFKGLPLVEQHRLVMKPLKGMIDSGELHALKIKTITP